MHLSRESLLLGRFERIVELANEGILTIGGDGRIDYINERGAAIMGYSPEELIGRPPTDLILPEDMLGAPQTEGMGERFTIEHPEVRSRRRDGSTVWLSLSVSPILGSDSSLQGSVGIFSDITERKEAEEALKRSEERYRQLVLYAPIAIFEIDLTTMRFKSVNDAMCRMTGHSREELLSSSSLDLLDSWGQERFLQDIGERIAGRRTTEAAEYRFRTKDGRERWGTFQIKLTQEDGRTIGALIIGRDETEKKETRDALRRSEMRFRMILENSRDGIYLLDPGTGRFLFASPSVAELTGFSLDELNEMTAEGILERIHPDDRARTAGRHALMEENMTAEPEERRWRVKSGEYRWFSNHRRLVRDEQGRPAAIVGTSRDITRRKEEEQALRNSEERLSLALSAGHLGIWNWSMANGASVWTQEVYRMLGYEVGDVEPSFEAWIDRVHPEDRAALQGLFQYAFEQGGRYEAEFRALWPEGKVRWIYAQGFFEFDQRGLPARTYGVMMDITDRKNAERELERYAEELERSNADLQQFAYVASHDLQEPLRMVSIYLDLLTKRHGGELSASAAQYVSVARDGAERMRQLVRDLLEYSRVETKVNEFRPVDMNAVASLVMEELSAAIEEAGAEVCVGELPTVLADEVQMKQLLSNLIANAVKFRGAASPVVEVSCSERGGDLVFSVRDNGIGIEPAHADRLFKMFSRLHTRDEYPGTGIGLAISKKIVERHGGRIWAESDGVSGSTFLFTLPKKHDRASMHGTVS